MAFILGAHNRDGEESSLVGSRYSSPCTEVGGYVYRGKAGFSISHLFSSNSLLGLFLPFPKVHWALHETSRMWCGPL